MNNTGEEKNLESIFKEAAENVKNLPEHLQEKAFEIAVARLSSDNITDLEKKTKDGFVNDKSGNDFFHLMEIETGTPKDHLKSVYKTDKDGDLKIVAALAGKTSEKQRTLAYVYLLGMKIGFSKEWVSALKFADKANDYGINDGHISKNLKQENGMILQGGRRRGKEYSLSPNGVQKAKQLLNNYIHI